MPNAPDIPVIDEGAEVPSGSRFVYHLAGRSDVDSILTNGFDPTCHISDHSSEVEFLEAVAEGEGIFERPDSRQDCVFAYTNRETALHVANNLSSEVLFVISLSRVSAPMYASDCRKFTKFTQCGRDPQYSWSHAHDTYESEDTEDSAWEAVESALSYWESVRRVSSGKELMAFGDGMRKPEVMVDGAVPPSAIAAIYYG